MEVSRGSFVFHVGTPKHRVDLTKYRVLLFVFLHSLWICQSDFKNNKSSNLCSFLNIFQLYVIKRLCTGLNLEAWFIEMFYLLSFGHFRSYCHREKPPRKSFEGKVAQMNFHNKTWKPYTNVQNHSWCQCNKIHELRL